MAKPQQSVTPIIVEPESRSDMADQPAWLRGIDRMLSVQRPAVVAHIRSLRRAHPNATPQQLTRILETRYLLAITTGGAAVGATAMVPAIGTGVTLALSGVETVGFLEATALFAQSVTEVHGIALADPTRARALVMTLMLGKSGTDLVRQFTGQVFHNGPQRKVFWGEMITANIPQVLMGPVADELKKRFLRHFAASQGASLVGKAVPFGIGAAIGGIGNNMAGRQVIKSARGAFGPAPFILPAELEPKPRAERNRLTIRELRERMPLPTRRRKAIEPNDDTNPAAPDVDSA